MRLFKRLRQELVRAFAHVYPIRIQHGLSAGMRLYGHPFYNRRSAKLNNEELLYRALSAAGYQCALSNTIHFIIGEEEEPNLYKMATPGRFFLRVRNFAPGSGPDGCRPPQSRAGGRTHTDSDTSPRPTRRRPPPSIA